MSTFSGPKYYYIRTALELLNEYPQLYGKNGYYYLYINGENQPGELLYCDMTTDGGGWTLVARSHPSVSQAGWGWNAGKRGEVESFTDAYNLGWKQTMHVGGATFTSMLLGNRKNLLTNEWGPFIYKYSLIDYITFMTSDTQQGFTRNTIKYDLSIYNYADPPGMQMVIGFYETGSSIDIFYMRDCCGIANYGGKADGMVTTYINNETYWYYSGPWAMTGYDATSKEFNQIGGNAAHYGGTNQYMIFVR